MKIKTLLPILGLTSVAAAAPVVASCAKNPEATANIEYKGSTVEFTAAGETADLTFHYTGGKNAVILLGTNPVDADVVYPHDWAAEFDTNNDFTLTLTLRSDIGDKTSGKFAVTFQVIEGTTDRDITVNDIAWTVKNK